MKECSKSIVRRLHDSRFIRKYFCGDGIDIGGAPDPLKLYIELFPLMRSVRTWDIIDGDAQKLNSIGDEMYDFVFSSHCLEHLNDPLESLQSWMRVTKPLGYLIFIVPDEDLYEQGVFPSTFNKDHKHTFTIGKTKSWSPKSIDILRLLTALGPVAAIERIELLDATYRYNLPRSDQTITPIGEGAIEVVIRKRSEFEMISGAPIRNQAQPDRETREHFNQYKDDISALKLRNLQNPPFSSKSDI